MKSPMKKIFFAIGDGGLWVTLAVLLAGIGEVKANLVTYSLNDFGGNSHIVFGQLPQFDPALGQLTSVRIQFDGSVACSYLVVNNSSIDTPFAFSVSALATMSGGILSASGAQTTSFNGIVPANSFFSVDDAIGVSGVAETSLASDLASFIGTSFVGGYGSGECNLIASDPSNLDYWSMYPTGDFNGYEQISYTYTPYSQLTIAAVSEPATTITGVLLLAPFGVQGFKHLRKVSVTPATFLTG